MRFVRFARNGHDSWGAVAGDGIVDLGARLAGEGLGRFDDVLARGLLARARDAADRAGDLALADVTLLPPVERPEKIFCVGINYPDRNEEYGDAGKPPYPSLFVRNPRSFVGHGQPIERPGVSTQLDYEGEIVLVIGKGGRRISQADAMDHVAGLSICNEGSVRDWIRHGKFNVTQGKNFDRSGSIGPWMMTLDEAPPVDRLHLVTRVNGEVRQDDTTERLYFPFPMLIEYITTFTTLVPGDVIVTGTPTGAGARFDPPRYLVPGDVVEVEVDGVGLLRNSVVDE